MSLPLRKCGLKPEIDRYAQDFVDVTSLAEVWIETTAFCSFNNHITVTSLAEVWIETDEELLLLLKMKSLPLRKCGLKQV